MGLFVYSNKESFIIQAVAKLIKLGQMPFRKRPKQIEAVNIIFYK